MPFVFRDPETKAVTKAMMQSIHGAEYLPHDHPDLQAFLQSRGVESQMVLEAIGELRRTDMDMSRAVEDVITALLKKNILKMSDLPKAVQDRIALRVKMRMQISEAYDRATNARATAG